MQFLEPWYLSWKYFTEEIPNTASITKWVIGILKNKHNIPDDFLKSNDKTDFEKLESAIVDNSFQMNSEEVCFILVFCFIGEKRHFIVPK